MPAGVGDVVVELVVGVPAQHHVAEAHAALERRLELVDVQVLAAQDAVDVVDAHLDVAQPALLDDLQGVGGGLDLARFHRSPLLAAQRLAAGTAGRPAPTLHKARSQGPAAGWAKVAIGQPSRQSFAVAATAPSTRARVHSIFRHSEIGPGRRRWRALHLTVLTAGLLAIAISSLDGLPIWTDDVLTALVVLVAVVFFVEYLVRLWAAPESTRYARLGDGMARLHWALSINGLIGLLAIMPAVRLAVRYDPSPAPMRRRSSASSGS